MNLSKYCTIFFSTTNTDEKISQLRTRLEGVSAKRKVMAAENDP